MDPAWSETGDRYMLKLFRDYLFHQVDENAAPWLDMAHVVQCLNKVTYHTFYKSQPVMYCLACEIHLRTGGFQKWMSKDCT